MREILFRGKRSDNGEWVEGFYCFTGQYHVIITGHIEDKHIVYGHYSVCVPMYVVDPATIGQYTGLGKNGKRIFEGDIVYMCFVDTNEIGEIIWDEEWSKTAYLSQDGDKYGIDGTVEMEVIGNIHDNPELMEVR